MQLAIKAHVMKFRALKFGPFPHEMINRTLGTELEPGDVYLSVRSQEHMAQKHPVDFSVIAPNFEKIVLSPTWVGQAPH